MGVTITEEFRTEFEQVGPDGVRKRINAALYSNEKQKAAYEWLDERERGPDRSIARSATEAAWVLRKRPRPQIPRRLSRW